MKMRYCPTTSTLLGNIAFFINHFILISVKLRRCNHDSNEPKAKQEKNQSKQKQRLHRSQRIIQRNHPQPRLHGQRQRNLHKRRIPVFRDVPYHHPHRHGIRTDLRRHDGRHLPMDIPRYQTQILRRSRMVQQIQAQIF